jgi:hypothetical protein
MRFTGFAAMAAVVAATALAGPVGAARAQSWPGYGRDPQHSAVGTVGTQLPQMIRWSVPVDLNPQHNQGDLLIHYGTPLVTRGNTVIVTIKTGAFDGFRVEAHRGTDGAMLWGLDTDYSVPPHGWVPSCGCTLAPKDRMVVIPASGGTVLTRLAPDRTSGAVGRMAFFGNDVYNANPAGFNTTVKISTPITSDRDGNLFFGFVVLGTPPAPLTTLKSGLARISTTGVGTWVAASAAANDATIQKFLYNCAPALSAAGDTVYVGVTDRAPGDSSFGSGYLLALDSKTLATKAQVRLKDVKTPANNASLSDDGTASPTVGPDGDVYFGVLERPFYSNHARGWLLHFSGDLSQAKTPSAFGWDDTASVVDAALVPSYSGGSSYLLLTKYNNYVEGGGDGVNRLAIVDPNATMTDPITGATVMQTVLTVAGVTPDPNFDQTHPNAVREWCINTAVIDAVNKAAVVNSEDGNVYRWDFTTNTVISQLPLNAAIGEAYTPTVVGPDGAIYAINNAKLYSCASRLNPPSLPPPLP